MGLSGSRPGLPGDLSIVTVCMNRRAHLLATAPKVAAWPHHREHLIVDWSSREPLRREELPADPRLRLLRVEGESRWNLCRAYNFAIARAQGEVILKLDADCWPTPSLRPEDPALRVAVACEPDQLPVPCAFGRGPDGQNGQFLIGRGLFEAVGGFNECLVGYGFDDKDLRARLRLHLGGPFPALAPDTLAVIPHSDAERAELAGAVSLPWLRASQGLASLRASRQANRLLAAHCPWGSRSLRSRYREAAPGIWRVDPATVPRPPRDVAAEIEHDRRMTFWSCFLGIPEVFLERMPYALAPPLRDGRWDVRWWHRLWWHTGRLLLQLPVELLIGLRNGLHALGSLAPRRTGRPERC